MIYVHCGWPRTGTTSFQAAMARNRDLLLAAGVVYPDRWGRKGDDSHNRLADLLQSADKSEHRFEELRKFLVDHRGKDFVISSESFTTGLLGDRACESLQALLSIVQQVAPVVCIWTLRRFDELIHSLYAQHLEAGLPFRSPAVIAKSSIPLFTNMRKVENAIEGRSTYLKYDLNGSHNDQLVRGFSLPDRITRQITDDIRAHPRSHVTRARGPGNEGANPSELLPRKVLLELRERALAAAREAGASSYLRFFG